MPIEFTEERFYFGSFKRYELIRLNDREKFLRLILKGHREFALSGPDGHKGIDPTLANSVFYVSWGLFVDQPEIVFLRK